MKHKGYENMACIQVDQFVFKYFNSVHDCIRSLMCIMPILHLVCNTLWSFYQKIKI